MITDKYQLELRHLKYFLAVAEEMHFRKAADRLYIAQPGLSRQIKQLEVEIGCQLFHRHNRKVELTAAGSFLQQACYRLFSQLDGAIKQARYISSGESGELKFGYVASAMHQVLPDVLGSIREAYPDIHFDLRQWDNQRQLDAIREGYLDLAFVRMDEIPIHLKSAEMHSDTFSLVLPADYEVGKKMKNPLSLLRDEPFILFDPSYSLSYYQQMMEVFSDAGFTPDIAHKTVHAATIYNLVERGFGVSMVPTCLRRGYDYNLKFVELDMIPQRTRLYMVWNPENVNPVMDICLPIIMEDV